MDEILDQLEQRTEHSLVLTEKLFENYGMTDIQEFQKKLHERLKQKNFQLKELFSTKYQELLDCSELVNDIKVYTKKIVQISNVCEKSLNLLIDEEQKEILTLGLNFSKNQESITMFKNQVNKIFKKLTEGLNSGLSYIPNLIFEQLSILLKQIPYEKGIQIFVKEKIFVLEQIKKSFINSLEDGSAFQRVRKYFGKNTSETNSFILSLDILFFFLKHDPENIVSRVLNFITQFFNYSPFEAVIVAQTLFTVYGNLQAQNLDTYFNLMHASLDELIQLNSLEQFTEYCRRQDKEKTVYPNECSFILKKLQDNSVNYHEVLILNIEKWLIKNEDFNHQLFQSLYQDKSVQPILQRDNADQRLQQRCNEWLNKQISLIFHQIEIIPEKKKILNVDNILQLKLYWDEKSIEVIKSIEKIILESEKFPDIYNLEILSEIIKKQIQQTEDKIQEAGRWFFQQRSDEQFDEILQQCACTSYYFGIIKQSFKKVFQASKSQTLQKQQIAIDETIIRQNLLSIIHEARINLQLTFRELIDILEKLILNSYKLDNEFTTQQKSFTQSFIEMSMIEYKDLEIIDFLDNAEQISDADMIYYINIINMINPKILNRIYSQNKKVEQEPKQLKKVTQQIKQSEQQNFVIFSQPLQMQSEKKFDVKTLDQSGLQAWTMKMSPQIPQTKLNQQKQDAPQQQSMFNIISTAKERASNLTNLIYKQQQ